MRWPIQATLTALVVVVIPLLAGDELVGVLTLDLGPGHVVDEHARALLVSFAFQAVVALLNARLFAQMRCSGPCRS
ncbi:MAG: GAF domain-containing protein [Candidatus Rokubacteria bacterium]|nr:GAF domain-containing protein [Candidatus Rokubacteria bacterium]